MIFFAIVNSIVIPFEKKNLSKAFGQEYEKYRRKFEGRYNLRQANLCASMQLNLNHIFAHLT